MPKQKIVLVTGASSGIGRETARRLAEDGYRAFGTSRRIPGEGAPAGVEMLRLDVRDDASVAACVRSILEQAGNVDVLVNNAGYELAGAAEESSLEEAKAQFETNFFGMFRMVKAVLPSMRQRKSGQIINISSAAGRGALPFMAFYTASKYAMEGFSEVLRIELKPFNIRVSEIEVGFVKTAIKNNRQVAVAPIADYEPWRRRALDAVIEHEKKAPGPELVAGAVRRIIRSDSPRLRYVVGRQAKMILGLRSVLPEWAVEQATMKFFRLDEPRASGV